MSAATETRTHPPAGVGTIAVDQIDVEEGHNPRQRFDEAELAELEASIAEHGVVQAITVRPATDEGRFTLVSGQRRLIAAKRAGLNEIPALVRDGDGALGAAVAENLTRADLDVVEEAEAVKRLAELEDLDQAGVANRIGKSRSWVSERLRLLRLPGGCLEGFASGELPLAAEKPLREVAKVSAEVAEALVARALADGSGDRIVIDLAGALYSLRVGVRRSETRSARPAHQGRSRSRIYHHGHGPDDPSSCSMERIQPKCAGIVSSMFTPPFTPRRPADSGSRAISLQ